VEFHFGGDENIDALPQTFGEESTTAIRSTLGDLVKELVVCDGEKEGSIVVGFIWKSRESSEP
jgi:hypothetical protein